MRPRSKIASPRPALPPGFLYVPDLISAVEERALLVWLAAAPSWNEVTFRGQRARRLAMSFGARYLAQARRLLPAPPLPPELAVYRDRMVAAAVAGLGGELALAGRTSADFALCTALHYPAGAAIGWHADNPAYGPTVMSLSLAATARLQMRRADDTAGAPAHELELLPRSLFVLAGEARAAWQHRLCPVRAERYSLTVRTPAAASSSIAAITVERSSARMTSRKGRPSRSSTIHGSITTERSTIAAGSSRAGLSPSSRRR
jgi:DNA oxidative demethylase